MLNKWLFNQNKLKTNCKLGISRIKLLRNKKQIALKGFRREVADLLRAGKQGNARIRVESVIRETLLLQAFDTLEVYLELLAVRVELLAKTKEMPPDMMEAICSLIYAAERISSDLPEIAVIRSMLASKYGGLYKDFAQAAASDAHYREWQVNEGLVSCLSVEAPGAEQKIAVLESICEEHGIPFDAAATRQEMGQGRLYQPPARPVGVEGGVGGLGLQPSWGATQFSAAMTPEDGGAQDGTPGAWQPPRPEPVVQVSARIGVPGDESRLHATMHIAAGDGHRSPRSHCAVLEPPATLHSTP
ncbi:hypothetical protein ACKKBF_B36040 [Auxenochlorella protothecoides x Auxenochlorella symbiontica]|uniref:IST1-like protein n=1 Tax=Auxenochlorella protothecoides TaxID=3075 RepID=A0A1D2AEA4_AUXPR